MNLEKEGLWLSVIDAAPMPLWLIEPDGTVALVNEAAATVLGHRQRHKLIGRSSHETLHPRRRDGSPYPSHACPIVNASGSVRQGHAEEFIDRRGRHVRVRWTLRQLEDSHYKLLSFSPTTSHSPQGSPRASAPTVTLEEIKAYIDSHCEDPTLSPQHLAARAGVSLRKLQSLFAAEGTSPAREIRQARLHRGHRMLSDGQNVAEAAFSCGFKDVSTFSRAYRRTFQRSPAAAKGNPSN
ncbi:helix-turn-helix domain-containing protein [Nesterenkonia natronophila]|uniref:Helix-turn-helix domain-containing protein n=1 Tax=Nesterenkonia natronophila TaxID=2174932 RepID=A0A3A4F3R8_9MICC|nr:helix-turn-helix domain-containing protein [Nesterenkonia natronophila]RJN31110.1 helix-turn-helix domain-containing protein [Nesterenkonia natronophila]